MVDEWGTWWDQEPGTIPGHNFQQNTMRDAMVAALTLNVFHKYTERIRMTNIAQITNVLQSMILTRDDKMVLTPTYHVFKMYKVHQDATFLPIDLQCERRIVSYDRIVPTVSATASRNQEGDINISLANIDLNKTCDVEIALEGVTGKQVSGVILTSDNISDHNTFDNADKVQPQAFDKARISKGVLKVTLPAKSIVTLSIR